MSLPGFSGGGAGVSSSSVDIGDNVAYSLMLDSGSSQYLSKTFGSAGNRKTWTFSCWMKRGILSSGSRNIFSGPSGTPFFYSEFTSTDSIEVGLTGGSSAGWTTTAKFRDPSAWYHIVIVLDTTSATGTMAGSSTDRLRLYVNNVQYVMTGGTVPTLNADYQINNNVAHYIGSQSGGSAYQGAYYANPIFIGGSALSPSDFGCTSADTGAWVNKTYTGSYSGTNSFFLDFADSADLGNDVSGNNNDWTTNGGISSANQYTDTPTNNHSIWNKLNTATTATLTLGNTKTTASTIAVGSMGMTGSMKSYWEVSSAGGTTTVGMWNGSVTTTTTIASGKTYGIRFDAGAGTLDYINITDAGAWTAITTGLTVTPYFQYVSTAAATTATLNSGSKSFAGSVPSGYSALCTANLPTPAVVKASSIYAQRYESGSTIASGISSDRSGWPDWIEIFKRSDTTESWKVRFSDDTSNMLSFDSTGAKGAWSAPSTGTYWGCALKSSATNGIIFGSYTGDNTSNRNITHSLGAAPTMAIVKSEGSGSWYIWHTGLTGAAYWMGFGATQSNTNTPWGTGNWSSTQFMVTNNATNNLNANAVVYRYILFTPIEGLVSTPTWTGNASADGPFIYHSGLPGLFISLLPNVASGTYLTATTINTYNVVSNDLRPQNNGALESASMGWDLNSNGIKFRSTLLNTAVGQAGLAISALPLKYATAR